MRLLSADPHMRFNSCNDPIALAGGYAVLSHVWQDIEQSYAEIVALEQEFAPVSDPRLSVKVRKCWSLAQAHGLPWFWVDAPCIDQKNSAELSEAISSMYEWYAQASICFAHLPDVPSDDDIRASGSAFRKSVYFRRAWTLQELIAPRRVVFLSAEWTNIGEKHELADLLEEITGIDRDVLTFRRPLSDVSVADRLSWASHRSASRPEDKAYCLMGLFGIQMTALYGEGAYKAFGRLQLKILEEVCDHTLLAWTESQDLPNPSVRPLAPSPEAFTRQSRIITVDMKDFVASIKPLCSLSYPGQPLVPCIGPVDHHGLRCSLPVLCLGSMRFAALLSCREEHSPSTYIALALRSSGSLVPGVYDVGAPAQQAESSLWPPSRLLRVNLDLIAPHVAYQAALAQDSVAPTSALNMRFESFHIAATSTRALLCPSTTPLSISRGTPPPSSPPPLPNASVGSDGPRRTNAVVSPGCSQPRHQVAQSIRGAIKSHRPFVAPSSIPKLSRLARSWRDGARNHNGTVRDLAHTPPS